MDQQLLLWEQRQYIVQIGKAVICDIVFKSSVGIGDSPIFVKVGDIGVFKLRKNEVKELSIPEGKYNVTVIDRTGIGFSSEDVIVSEKKIKTVIVINSLISNFYRFVGIGILTMLFLLSLLKIIPFYISGIFVILIVFGLLFSAVLFRKKYFKFKNI